MRIIVLIVASNYLSYAEERQLLTDSYIVDSLLTTHYYYYYRYGDISSHMYLFHRSIIYG